MAYFVIVDDQGTVYGSLSALSAAFVVKNLKENQRLIEVDKYIVNPEKYVFDWDTRELRILPMFSDIPTVLAD